MAPRNGVSLNWGGLDRALDRAARKLSDKQALLDSVGEALVSGTLARFDAEKDPKGNTWKPSRRAQEEGGKTLSDTVILRRSVEYATAGDKVLVGSNLPYARIHQLGGKAGRGKKITLSARPYLGVSDEDREEVQATIADFLAGAFKGN